MIRRASQIARKGLGLALVLSALAVPAFASLDDAPEIDPGSIVGAVALLSSGLMMVMDRRRKA